LFCGGEKFEMKSFSSFFHSVNRKKGFELGTWDDETEETEGICRNFCANSLNCFGFSVLCNYFLNEIILAIWLEGDFISDGQTLAKIGLMVFSIDIRLVPICSVAKTPSAV
jgi:hypothetical protein